MPPFFKGGFIFFAGVVAVGAQSILRARFSFCVIFDGMYSTDLFDSAYLRFMRNYLETFSVSDVVAMFREGGIRTTSEEVEECLESDCYSIPLEDGQYITRAGAFSGQFFTFVPTVQEIEQGVVVPGDRCIPFVDQKLFPCDIIFSFNKNVLPEKKLEVDANSVYDYFSLTDIDIFSQYLDADPVNRNLHIADMDYMLPYNFGMTGFDFGEIFRITKFRPGDRMLAYVSDWDRGIVEILPLKIFFERRMGNVSRIDLELAKKSWFELLEKLLLESFDRHGPCESIDMQLMLVFFENANRLCVPLGGSIAEFLEWTDKIGIEFYGVERRLWRKGEMVEIDVNSIVTPFYDVPDFVIDSFIMDSLFSKENISDKELIERIIPESMDLSPRMQSTYSLQIENRRAKLRKSYNWFADFAFGEFRHRSIALYSDIRDLFFSFDCTESEFESFPRDEFVMLAQLYSHTMDLLDLIDEAGDPDGEEPSDEEMSSAQISLEGMEFSFYDIRPVLLESYERVRRGRFSLLS